MSDSTAGETLLLPQEGTASTPRFTTRALPTDLLEKGARRLRVLALLYAFVFFMAAFVPPLLFPEARAFVFGHVVNWLPGALSIAVALIVSELARGSRLSVAHLSLLGTVFEIVSSYGIATAEFISPDGLMIHGNWIGLSWVAVWVSLFTIVVPTTPKRTVLSALAAVSAVPVMVTVSLALYPTDLQVPAVGLFFGFIFPYILVVLMAYVSARVVFALGTEVRRARELGSYRLTERLGRGGMGEVWRASHRLLARPAAIKLIRPAVNAAAHGGPAVTDEARRRFEREAQTIARLRSPHTVNLFDFGVADDGAFYYVMELLDGLDAERLVRRFGPQPAERVIHLLRQMCHSLSEAESIGLVHRDIKPANIFLCRYGEDFDFVKILDFGIAKAVQERSGAEPTITSLTVDHVVQGTPAFIAPEQAMGSAVDGRADIYATGCVAYWLLTGDLVFTADTPMRVMMHHAHTVPAAPSTRTELPIPADLDALILSCLAKDPAGRPQSARELARRLGEIATAEPWSEERARQWWQEHLAGA